MDFQDTHALEQSAVTLVLGGARSGKSAYAQRIAERGERVLFLATATAGDEEMRGKIERHRRDRPPGWTTVEEPLDIGSVIEGNAASHDVIVVDCLTFYAANLLQAEGLDRASKVDQLCGTLRTARCQVVLVSNEVGSGVVPEYVLGREFRDLLGEINQRVAEVATEVVLMVAGLPLFLKSGHIVDVLHPQFGPRLARS